MISRNNNYFAFRQQ